MSHSNKWGFPLLTLSAYLRFWSVICYAVTIWLIFFETEVSGAVTLNPSINNDDLHPTGQRERRRSNVNQGRVYYHMGHMQTQTYPFLLYFTLRTS